MITFVDWEPMRRRCGSGMLALCMAMAGLAATPAHAVELYETGPAEDAAFLRFINATGAVLEVRSDGGQASLSLPPEQPASDFVAVHANRVLKGRVSAGKAQLATETTVRPGEFVTVVVLGNSEQGLQQRTLQDSPDDFNAMKATLVFHQLAPQCEQPSVQVLGRGVALFETSPTVDTPVRRQVNPVPLSVQLVCGGVVTGQPVDMGRLQAGGRYTLLAAPGSQGPILFAIADALAF